MLSHLVEAFIAFFVVINPFSKIPLFSTLAAGYTPARPRRTAIKSTVVAAAILVFFIALGQLLFNRIGVNLYAFKAAGGCVLLLLSLQMVMASPAQPDFAKNPDADISIFPIALTFIAGPATIMTVILQTDDDLYPAYEQALVTLMLLAVLGINFLFLLFAPVLNRVPGKSGNDILTRMLGLILAALAMQSIFSGVAGFFHLPTG